MENNSKSTTWKMRFLRAKYLVPAAVIVLLVIGIAVVAFNNSSSKIELSEDMPIFEVKRGPLRISVIESGTIQAREQIILKSEVEGRTTVLSLVEEGAHVEKGDLLVELDASELIDEKVDQEIRVQNAEASYIGARENLAVVENQAQSDIDEAELEFEFAKQDLEKYVEGEYLNERKKMESEITLAREELQTAQETLEWSKKLYKKEYISQTELQIDELAAHKKELDLELAESNLQLLEDFTHPRNLAKLESDVKQAEMALERTNRRAKADVVQAKAELRAKESEYERQKDKLKKIEEQITKAKIYAPADGLVIYATSAKTRHWRSSEEPLDEGSEVRERQELIYLPTASAVKAEVKIHEASLQKVKAGLPVVVTVDALPGKVFHGHVEKIAPLPDAQMVWLNPDLKVYNTEVYLEGEGDYLRTGMSCKAEIIIEEYNEAVYVPLQAVLRVRGEPTVYVQSGRGFEPRKVKVGLDNNRMIRIVEGLREGDVVLITPPLASATVEEDVGGAVGVTSLAEPGVVREAESGDGGQQPGAEKIEQGPGEGTRPSPEQMEKMRERFENMSEEERQEEMRKMQERFESMPEEEKQRMRKRWDSERRKQTGVG